MNGNTHGDGIPTPQALRDIAEMGLETSKATGQAYWRVAMDIAESDPTLDGSADYVLAAYARGVAATMSLLNQQRGTQAAFNVERAPNRRTKEENLLVLLSTDVHAGGKSIMASMANRDFWATYADEKGAMAAGLLDYEQWARNVVIKKLEEADVDRIQQLAKAEQMEVAKAWAALKTRTRIDS